MEIGLSTDLKGNALLYAGKKEILGRPMENWHTRGVLGPMFDSPSAAPLLPGDLVEEKYLVNHFLGAGSMGIVYSAVRPGLGDEVAIKVLRKEFLSDPQIVARFAREARAAVTIRSEHVACVFDVGHLPDGAPFIVMERLEGQDLGELIAERGALPVDVAIDYILQTCEALAIAHSRGITHRDVKPKNLFVSKQVQGEDVIKVLDFGISKMDFRGRVDTDEFPLVTTFGALGSPMYMSPEQIRAAKNIDGRADIWGLGCVLYELLTAHPAFSAPSLTELCATILERGPIAIAALGRNVPPELEAVVLRCLEKDPNRRFQDVGELAMALAPFALDRSILSLDRCSQMHEQKVADATSEADTLPTFFPQLPPAKWKRFVFPVVGTALIGGCCALLFSPHTDLRSPTGTGQSETPTALAPIGPPIGPHPRSEGVAIESLAEAPPLAATESNMRRGVVAPPKAASASAKSKPRVPARSTEELDVGF